MYMIIKRKKKTNCKIQTVLSYTTFYGNNVNVEFTSVSVTMLTSPQRHEGASKGSRVYRQITLVDVFGKYCGTGCYRKLQRKLLECAHQRDTTYMYPCYKPPEIVGSYTSCMCSKSITGRHHLIRDYTRTCRYHNQLFLFTCTLCLIGLT